jgi:hypothetical protein
VIENNIAEIKSILLFFDTLADDLILAHGNLLKFCNCIDDAERLDEAHLLPLALSIFGEHHFTQSGRYISVKKNIVNIYFGMNMRDAGIVCTAECRRAARHRRSGDAVTFG